MIIIINKDNHFYEYYLSYDIEFSLENTFVYHSNIKYSKFLRDVSIQGNETTKF